MTSRRVAFWGGVALVSVVANFTVEAIANRFPNGAVAHFASILHKG